MNSNDYLFLLTLSNSLSAAVHYSIDVVCPLTTMWFNKLSFTLCFQCSPKDERIFTVKLNVLVSGSSWGWDESSELLISVEFPDKIGLRQNYPCQFQMKKYVIITSLFVIDINFIL